MTNPNNAIGTNGAFDGRTSPNALNDLSASFTAGIVSGWACAPKTGMTVQLGGDATTRDVALAEDNAGNKLTINNRSGAPVEVTLDGAPSTNNRIDAIVAYVDNPSTGDGNTTDNPTTCGIIAVKGTVAANPVEPTDAQIRSAITTDGATGGVAYYAVLATIRVGTNVTTIGSGVITPGASVKSTAGLADSSVTTNTIADGAVTSAKVDLSTLNIMNYSESEVDTGATWIDGKKIYRKTVNFGTLPNSTSKQVDHNITNLSEVVRIDGIATKTSIWSPLPLIFAGHDSAYNVSVEITTTKVSVIAHENRSMYSAYVTIWYTKSS